MKRDFSDRLVAVVVLTMVLTTTIFSPLAAAAPQKKDEKSQSATSNQVAPEFAAAAKVNADDYIIGVDDLLNVNVWKEPEISRSVPVRPDGKITLPLIGDVVASGLTPRQLQANIAKALGAYMSSVDVAVSVQEVRSHKFNIVGEVQKPGAYVLNGSMTVLDAIALAGGLKDFAKGKKIYLLRIKADGSRDRLAFNYNQVIKGDNLNQNVRLEPRDTIVVP